MKNQHSKPNADERQPVVLSIAGSDSSAGAGIQADIKTCQSLGVYCASAITALTAQNTVGVQGILPTDSSFLRQQIDSVFEDLNVTCVKTGMLANRENTQTVIAAIQHWAPPVVVVDPVLSATTGASLVEAETGQQTLLNELIPLATLWSPNLNEAATLLNTGEASSRAEMEDQLEALRRFGAKAVLLKGGHLEGSATCDLLHYLGKTVVFEHPLIPTRNTHGTGCTLASAIAAYLVKGEELEQAVGHAIDYVQKAIKSAKHTKLGFGFGPLMH